MNKIMIPSKAVGISGYGAYVPAYRLSAREISKQWRDSQDAKGLPVKQKSVPGPDEDTITMAIEASQNALERAQIDAHRYALSGSAPNRILMRLNRRERSSRRL